MKEYAVIFADANHVGIDGWADINPSATGSRHDQAIFATHQEAKDHRDARAAANPGIEFSVVEYETA